MVNLIVSRRLVGLAGVTLVLALAACTPAGSQTGAASEGVPSEAPASGMAAGLVRVAVVDVEGSEGGSLAGVLYKGAGPEAVLLTRAPQDPNYFVGGFGVPVDADPFTTTQTINQPAPGEPEFVFPYVTDTPVQVEPGTYTLMLWSAPEQLTPAGSSLWGRWEPGLAHRMRGCWVTFEAEARTGANLTVHGIPEWHGVPEAPCTTG